MASSKFDDLASTGLAFPAEGLSTDELKVLAFRNKIKNYGSLSRQALLEKLNNIPDVLQNEITVKIDKPLSDLSQIEKRVLAQRLGIKNIRKISQKQLNDILEEKINQEEIDIPDIQPKVVKPRISLRKPLLEQAKEQGYKNYHNLSIEKLKELLSQPPAKRILKSDLILQAKNLGIDVKGSMKKSIIENLIERHSEFKSFNKIKAAFKGYTKHFQLEGLPKIGIKAYLEKIKSVLTEKIDQENKSGLKIAVVLHVSMQRKKEMQEFQLRSTHIIGLGEEINFDALIENLLADLKNLVQVGSGWKFIEITKVDLHTVNYQPFTGSSYIPLPKQIQNKRAVINVQNEDQKCFRYSIEAALLNIPKNTERVTNYNKPEFDHMFKDIEFPVTIKDIDTFEKNNPELAINVYTFTLKETELFTCYKISPVRISDRIVSEEKYINLLHYKDENIEENIDEKIEDVADNANYHYAWIKNFSKLVSKQNSKSHGQVRICFRCLKTISATTAELREKRYKQHLENCKKFECVKVSLPSDKNNILQFKDIKALQKHPVVIVADFESTLKKINTKIGTQNKTVQTQEHVPNSYSFLIQYNQADIPKKNKLITYIQQTEDENIADHFVENITEICSALGEKFLLNPKSMNPLTEHELKSYNEATNCYLCNKCFTAKNYKVRDHNHFTGKYRGAAHTDCNLQFQSPKFIPVYFHNLSGYDSHLFVKNLKGKLNVIANNSEDYISFSKYLPINENIIEIRFLDSYRLMQSSLDTLSKNLPNSEKKNLTKKFKGDKFDLLTRKGIYPYEWMDNFYKLAETEFPAISAFHSKFNNTMISQDDYNHAKNVWEEFDCKTFADYHKLYLETDVLLLADILENFRNTCLEIYQLDPAFFYTSPGLSWQAMLKMTDVKLELLTDMDMYNFFELGIRGGICQAVHRYAKANNKYLKNFDSKLPTSFITYLDANNLYGYAMSEKLPHSNFKWMTEQEIHSWQDIPCTLEVDLEYPEHLHNLHNSYPLCPEHENDKLMLTLKDKEKYIIHHTMLKFVLEQGLKLKKIHRGISYKESDFLKKYIDFNTTLRAKAKNDFEKDFFKLMNNSIFGKTMESVRRRKDIVLATNVNQLRKLVNSNNYRSHKIFSENLVMVERQKAEVYLNKPVYLGQAILDISKIHMYNFHYNHMMKKYSENIQLCYTDTDSLVYHIQTEDLFADMNKDSDLYDLSNFPKEHELYSETNKKVIGKFKEEEAGNIISEFIALRSKLYSYLTDKDCIKKCKGVKKQIVKNEITFEEYRKVLLEKIPIEKQMSVFRSREHQLYTEKMTKVALDANDDKRIILENGISTRALGYCEI